jgi:hypothetical protein
MPAELFACVAKACRATLAGMDLDAMLNHYFGTADLDQVEDAAFVVGRDRALTQFGLERDAGRRFGIWVMLHAIGSAPDPIAAFKNPAERKAAEDYAWAAERIGRD